MTVIILSGPIGAGKSSLTSILAEHLESNAFYEDVSKNPILPLYYKDMKRYTFLLNTYLLNKRLAQISEALSENNPNVILDRFIYEDALFSKMNVDSGIADPTEYDIYVDLVYNMMENVPGNPHKRPDLLIYINVSLDTTLSHVRRRGHEFEQFETDPSLGEYYAHLRNYYEPWYGNYSESPKMVIDGDKYNLVDNEDGRKAVLELIDNKLKELGNL